MARSLNLLSCHAAAHKWDSTTFSHTFLCCGTNRKFESMNVAERDNFSRPFYSTKHILCSIEFHVNFGLHYEQLLFLLRMRCVYRYYSNVSSPYTAYGYYFYSYNYMSLFVRKYFVWVFAVTCQKILAFVIWQSIYIWFSNQSRTKINRFKYFCILNDSWDFSISPAAAVRFMLTVRMNAYIVWLRHHVTLFQLNKKKIPRRVCLPIHVYSNFR